MCLLRFPIEQMDFGFFLLTTGEIEFVARSLRLQITKVFFGEFDGLLVGDIAASRDYEPLRAVVASPEIDHAIAINVGDSIFGTGDRTANSLIAPNDFINDIVNEIFGRIVDRSNFLDDD